ncbi:TonB-dependent receptor [Sphingomonas sp. C8-2]|nr:TonB-dependent receptor [Sphingomonas sp. C8-2]
MVALLAAHPGAVFAQSVGRAAPASAGAVSEDDAHGAGEIVVTANKREQSINDVGLTIQAATSKALDDRGIRGVADLGKLVPGFTATQSTFATPVYTLRGIGLYDASAGAAPAVAIYTDQVPRNFPAMFDALDLDIERVEILKGPQGTLFGQSSTGGAINYIAGKPTDVLKAGVDASYERFNRADIAGFISGPLTDTLTARLALRGISGGAWQYSVSRPDDGNGDERKVMGRLSLDWKPSEKFEMQASLTGARDRSDTQAPQYAGSFHNIYSAAALAAANADPATANPYGIVDDTLYTQFTTVGGPGFHPTFLSDQLLAVARMNGVTPLNALQPGLAAATRSILGTQVVNNNRGAEWTPNFLRGARDHYWQGTVRADLHLNDDIMLTSVTAYGEKKFDHTIDLDSTPAMSNGVLSFGKLKTFNQELRLTGKTDRLNWLVGANYDHLKTSDNNDYLLYDFVGGDPINGAVSGVGPIDATRVLFNTRMKTLAIFANGEYRITDALTATAGIRYTENRQRASYCAIAAQTNGANEIFTFLSQAFGAPASFQVTQGDCFVLGDGTGGTTPGIASLVPYKIKQNEHNVSFRAGLSYKLDNNGLIYAVISQGYKAGVFSNIGASVVSQYVPAKQEKLLSYEGGFKLPVIGNMLQFNGAAFYYDYTNKQVRTKIFDAVFGLVERLINVPKSRVWGLEGEIAARPMSGLTLSASATYINSKVSKSFSTFNGSAIYNTMGYTGDFKNSKLPFTPKFMATADAQYSWEMGRVRPFVGGTLVYQGSSNSTFQNDVLRADFFRIPSYHTVDARLGVSGANDSWRLSLYGRNIFNERVITATTFYQDAYFRMRGKPTIYGMSISVRY